MIALVSRHAVVAHEMGEVSSGSTCDSQQRRRDDRLREFGQ